MREVETITKQLSVSQWGRDSLGTGHGPISDPESFKASIHLVTCYSLATCRLAEHLLRAGPRSAAGTLWSREDSGPAGPQRRLPLLPEQQPFTFIPQMESSVLSGPQAP